MAKQFEGSVGFFWKATAYLRQWIEAPVEVRLLKDDLLVKLYSGLVPLPTVLAELQRHRSTHQERLA